MATAEMVDDQKTWTQSPVGVNEDVLKHILSLTVAEI